jgi:hypothetical protein
MWKLRNNPERTYGWILIFVSTLALLFLIAGRQLNHVPFRANTRIIIELSLMLLTGVFLLLSKKQYFIGRNNMMIFLVAVGLFYIKILTTALKTDGFHFSLLIYFLLFFLMNLMILIRVYRNKTKVY